MISIWALTFSLAFASQSMNLGFHPENSSSIPIEVLAAKDKIFKITLPYYQTIPQTSYDFVLAGNRFPEETRQAVSDCISTESPECHIPFSHISGTAFLDRNPAYIWTNCHIVYEWMKHSGGNQQFESSRQVRNHFINNPAPILLVDSSGEEVYGTEEPAYLSAFAIQRNGPGYDSACSRMDDLVKIQLIRPLAEQGLEWDRSNVNSTLYLGGFPRQTTSRASKNLTDSDGESFYWTYGDSINFRNETQMSYVLERPNMELITTGPYGAGILSDGVEGMSGSPVLTAEGKVVGIYKGFIPESDEARDIPFLSLYTNVQGMSFIEILSRP